MMGPGGTSSSNRCGFVSWCVDSAESQSPPTAPAGTATSQTSCLKNKQSSGSTPLLLRSDISKEEKEAAFHHQGLQALCMKRKTHKKAPGWTPPSSSLLPNKNTACNVCDVEGEDEENILRGHDGNLRLSEAEAVSKQEPSLRSEAGSFFLPRSHPVISRRAQPISWNGGESGASTPSSIDSPSPSSGSPCFGLSTSDQCQVDEGQHRLSLSSNLNSLLSNLHISHKQVDKDQRGWSQNSHNKPDPTDHCTPTPNNKGRSCSGMLDFPADIFRTSCELEKENAHFVVVDMVLEVLEGVKCSLSFDQWTSTTDTPQHRQRIKRHTSSVEDSPPHKQTRETQRREHGLHRDGPKHGSCTRTHLQEVRRTSQRDTQSASALQHTQCEEQPGGVENEHLSKCLSILSTDSGFEDCSMNTAPVPTDSLRNAEWLAQQLVLEFKRRWLPSHVLQRGRLSLRSSLQELPGTRGVEVRTSSLTEEIRLRTRMRGSLPWAPPCFQLIFTVQPPHRRSEMVALQDHLCAGCGTEVEPRYIKKLRYCEYLGRYFCDCCHCGAEAVIPGRVLSSWDFSKYSVSDFSKQLLDSVWYQPLFDLSCVGKTLFSRVKEMEKFRELQEQLLFIRKLLASCRFSTRTLAEFEQLPAHLLEQPALFSMDDLQRVKKGQLVVQARTVLQSAIKHVENCELCLARGFICEFCREKDILFPFQRDICTRCTVCKACFHKHCFVERKCPKCTRIQSRAKSRCNNEVFHENCS